MTVFPDPLKKAPQKHPGVKKTSQTYFYNSEYGTASCGIIKKQEMSYFMP